MSKVELMPGFNVRVYGALLTSDSSEVLLVEEDIQGHRLLKFPGGGVDAGEAPGEALRREFMEELQLEVKLDRLLYVSPHFHLSTFRPQQLVGLYWLVQPKAGPLTPRDRGRIQSALPQMRAHWQKLKGWDGQSLTHPLDVEFAQQILTQLDSAVKS